MSEISRRQLLLSLPALALAPRAFAQASVAPIRARALNHMTLAVSDPKRSVEFYQRVFGLPLQSENKTAQLVQLKLGKGHLSIRRGDGPKGVDHFAIGLDRFNKDSVIADLKARGAIAREDAGAGLHVVDPDGLNVQLIANQAG